MHDQDLLCLIMFLWIVTQGITPFIQSDFDLISVAQYLLTLIPITVKAAWVKGQSQATQKSIQQDLNILADQLAGDYERCPDPSFHPSSMNTAPPHYRIHLLHDNSMITVKLYRTLHSALYSELLKAHISYQ